MLRGEGGFERRSDERCGYSALMGWKREVEENEGKSTSPLGMFCLPLRLHARVLRPGDRSICVDVIVRWESTRIWPRPFQWLCPRLGQSTGTSGFHKKRIDNIEKGKRVVTSEWQRK